MATNQLRQKEGKLGYGAVTPQKTEKSTKRKGLLDAISAVKLIVDKRQTHNSAATRILGVNAATACPRVTEYTSVRRIIKKKYPDRVAAAGNPTPK